MIFPPLLFWDFWAHEHLVTLLQRVGLQLEYPNLFTVNPQTTANLSIPIFSHVCTQGTPNPQSTAHLSIWSFICSLGLSSRESDSTVRWLDLEAGLHEVDGEPLREQRLVIEYQVSSIKFQKSCFKYQVPLESGAVGRRWTRRCPSPRRRCPPQTW